MKKKIVLIFLMVITMTPMLKPQSAIQDPPKKEMQYSFFWGLFKSKNYPEKEALIPHKETVTSLKTEELILEEQSTHLTIDTSKYDKKSILWGAIQWTEKKKIQNAKN